VGQDARAGARARRGELAVLHTVGASPQALGRSVMVEQVVVAGLAVGVATTASMGLSLVITPEGAVPVPPPRLVLPGVELVAVPLVLLVAAVVLGAVMAGQVRRDVAAQALRIGQE
jgi:ABC-type antimicrobial peptide transport system permease subunit